MTYVCMYIFLLKYGRISTFDIADITLTEPVFVSVINVQCEAKSELIDVRVIVVNDSGSSWI